MSKSIFSFCSLISRYVSTLMAMLIMLTIPALSVELFRYRGAAKGGTIEYVFDGGEQNSPKAVAKEKAAEITADFMTTFYHVQVGALESGEFRNSPAPFWLICFSDMEKGPLKQMSSLQKNEPRLSEFWPIASATRGAAPVPRIGQLVCRHGLVSVRKA
jgi:hypothetical protein